jgi:hypothetical protein
MLGKMVEHQAWPAMPAAVTNPQPSAAAGAHAIEAAAGRELLFATRPFAHESVGRSWWHACLWDEDRQQMVSYREARRRANRERADSFQLTKWEDEGGATSGIDNAN